MRHLILLICLCIAGIAMAQPYKVEDDFTKGTVRTVTGKGKFSGVLPPSWIPDFPGWNSCVARGELVNEGPENFLRIHVDKLDSQRVQLARPISPLSKEARYRLTIQYRNRTNDNAELLIRQQSGSYSTFWKTRLPVTREWKKMTFYPELSQKPEWKGMRITAIDGEFLVCHANWLEPWGSLINIARTRDFRHFEAVSHSVPANRNAVLFPEKIHGNYARLERPQNIDGRGGIWYSESPDLEFWGRSMPVMLPATDWAQMKTGAGTIPIRTEHGWLEVYHATAMTASTENYYLGACLLDLEQPWKVVAAPKSFLLAAEELYECVGQTPNVVFTGGGCEMPDGTYHLYYGAADTRVCLATTTVNELLDFCLNS